MRRYDITVTICPLGVYEVIRDNPNPSGVQVEDYWAECFTWMELKVLVPAMRRLGWRVKISSVDEDDVGGRIHIFPFTYGVNHDVRMLTVAGARLVLTRVEDIPRVADSTFNPLRY